MTIASRTLVAVALAAAVMQLSCSVNDYCLNCAVGDAGAGDGGGDDDGGSSTDANDGGTCIPSAETCNGMDDDCDGQVDNPPVQDVGVPCANQMGACAGSTQVCTNGALRCSVMPAPESCNGSDDNCNGMTDEGNPEGGGTCGIDTGECVAGVEVCNATLGMLECIGFVDRRNDPEICDAKDNDCDNMFDEGLGSLGACGPSTNEGECNIGSLMCQGGAPVCMGAVFPRFETCNNLDDDCDMAIDEIYNKQTDPTNCGTCGNVCPAEPNANTVCAGGTCGYTCRPGFHDLVPGGGANAGCEFGPCFISGAEACDGEDNDCDSRIDEGLTPPPICLSGGECGVTAPTAQCNGMAGWSCTYTGNVQFPETRCDGLDNDCDSNTDENQPNLGQICHEEPETACTDALDNDNDGGINDGCPAMGTAESGTACTDNLDNDSDGRINDGCPALAGQGACRGTGAYACDSMNLDGPARCSITSPGAAPGTESCNDLDDDCDGASDEGATGGNLPGQEWVDIGGGRQIMKYEAARHDSSNMQQGSKASVVVAPLAASPNGATQVGTTATFTTLSPHGLTVGTKVRVSGVAVSGYNGIWTVATVTATTFTATVGSISLAGSGGGTVSRYNGACSKAGVFPWTNVTYLEALAVCESMGASLCDESRWHHACSVIAPSQYPRAVSAAGTRIEAEDFLRNSPAGGAETGAQCTNAVDDDNDNVVNDGCPALGPPETGTQCNNNTDQDADTRVNDGCPVTTPHSWVPETMVAPNQHSGLSNLRAVPNNGVSNTAANAIARSPRLDYQVTIPTMATDWRIHVRMFSTGGNDNQIHLGTDTNALGSPAAPTISLTTTANNTWQWISTANLTFNAGTLNIRLFMQEDGLKIDSIYIVRGAGGAPGTLNSAGGNWSYATMNTTYQPMTCNGTDYSAANDNIIPTGTAASCFADHTGVNDVYDMSGNVKEWTLSRVPNQNPIRGGASNDLQQGISCPLNFTLATDTFFFPNVGFRCCRGGP